MTARPKKLYFYYPQNCESTILPLSVGLKSHFGLSFKAQIIGFGPIELFPSLWEPISLELVRVCSNLSLGPIGT